MAGEFFGIATVEGDSLILEGEPTVMQIRSLYKPDLLRELRRVNLSKLTRIYAPQALTLLCIIDKVKAFGRYDLNLVQPENYSCRAFLFNTGFCHFLDDKTFPSLHCDDRHVPLLNFSDYRTQGIVVRRVLEYILQKLEGISKDIFISLEWVLYEITGNVLQHSRSPNGGYLFLHEFKGNQSVIEYIVADAGIGITTTLKSSFPSMTDTEILTKSVEEGVTSDTTNNQGNGLYGSYMISKLSGGHFEIQSGKSSLRFAGSSKRKGISPTLTAQSVPSVFPGSLVKGSLNYKSHKTVIDALMMSGRPFAPFNTYVEAEFEDDQQNLVVDVKRTVHNTGSRPEGARLAKKILNVYHMYPNSKIIIDFSDLPIIPSSFADEAIAKTIVKIDHMSAGGSQRLVIKNASDAIKHVIGRTLEQRRRASF